MPRQHAPSRRTSTRPASSSVVSRPHQERSSRRRRALPRAHDRLAVGRLQLSPLWVGQVGTPTVVSEAFDAGHNTFVVSADLHWPAHEALRQGLSDLLTRRGVRDHLVVVGVSSCAQPAHAMEAFKDLLDAIPRLERLDILGLGGVAASDTLQRVAALSGLRRAHALGCEAVAASFTAGSPIAGLLEGGLVDLGLVRFNAADDASLTVAADLRGPRHAPLLATETLGGYVSAEDLDALGVDPWNWRPSTFDHHRFALSLGAFDGLVLSPLGLGEAAKLDAALARGPLDSESQAYLARTARLGRPRGPRHRD